MGQESAQDSEEQGMILASGNNCVQPVEAGGEAGLDPLLSPLPTRKRSHSLEDKQTQATGTGQPDGVSKKIARHWPSLSCARPREGRCQVEDPRPCLTTEPRATNLEVEDIGPDVDPDPCYGLLGTTLCSEAQSHICSLPSEVLRHIFAFLPMEDLYWNLSLVCHLWREVINDPLVGDGVVQVSA